jgi:hypothetical protein
MTSVSRLALTRIEKTEGSQNLKSYPTLALVNADKAPGVPFRDLQKWVRKNIEVQLRDLPQSSSFSAFLSSV